MKRICYLFLLCGALLEFSEIPKYLFVCLLHPKWILIVCHELSFEFSAVLKPTSMWPVFTAPPPHIKHPVMFCWATAWRQNVVWVTFFVATVTLSTGHTSATLCWFQKDRKTTISHKAWVCHGTQTNKIKTVIFKPHIWSKTEIYVGLLHFFPTLENWKRSRHMIFSVISFFFTVGKVSQCWGTWGSNFLISSCQVHRPHFTGIPGEGQPPPQSPPLQRSVSQPDLRSVCCSLHKHPVKLWAWKHTEGRCLRR